MTARWPFVLVLSASCGGRKELSPVRPVAPAPVPSAIAPTREDPPPPPSAGDVKESDVVVTGGFGAAKDRFLRAGDPQPGSKIVLVRFTCEVGKSCAPASALPEYFETRFRECFTVTSRAATAGELANVVDAVVREKGTVAVPDGHVFIVERRHTRREEVMETLECPKNTQGRHPCDPARVPTGRFVEKTESDLVAVGPRQSDVSVPFRTWTLHRVELRHLTESIETVDVSTLPPDARAAVVFDRAVDAVRSKDRKRVAAAVKEVDAHVTIADGTRIEDQRINRTLAQTIVNEMPMIRAVAEGRATVGDACKR